jgi:hypothetical protein
VNFVVDCEEIINKLLVCKIWYEVRSQTYFSILCGIGLSIFAKTNDTIFEVIPDKFNAAGISTFGDYIEK